MSYRDDFKGKHLEDLQFANHELKARQKELLVEMMRDDEKDGLYM